MAYLGKYYRTYALDFWGFGESGKQRETYAIQDFVSLVKQFMDQLGITRAPLVVALDLSSATLARSGISSSR